MKKLFMISALSIMLVACGGAVKEKDLVQKYQLTPNSAVHWDQTIMHIIPAEAKLLIGMEMKTLSTIYKKQEE